MIGPRRDFHRDDAGQVAILVAFAFLGLCFAVALVVNVGQLLQARRAGQSVADASALAGARALQVGGDQLDARRTAVEGAIINGIDFTWSSCTGTGSGAVQSVCTDSSGKVTITVNTPPVLSTTYASSTDYVEVKVDRSTDSLLFSSWGATTVAARAVAGKGPSGATNSIYALGTGNICPGLDIQGGTVSVYGLNGPPDPGVIHVNSSGTTGTCGGQNAAAYEASQGTIGPTGAQVDIVGGTAGGSECANLIGDAPTPTCGEAVAADPYAGQFERPWPSNVPTATKTTACLTPCVLDPGIYTEPSNAWNNNDPYCLLPGVYIIRGNGIGLSGNGALTTGAGCVPGNATGGVVIYLTYPTYDGTVPFGQQSGCADVTLGGGGTSSLLPPDGSVATDANGIDMTGYEGLLIFQDPYCAPNTAITINGGGAVATAGLIYMPQGSITMNGGPATSCGATFQQIVARTLRVQNGTLCADMATGGGGLPGATRLAE